MSGPEQESSRSHGGSSPLGRLVLIHFGMFAVFITWAFGGQAPWARQIIAWWGTLGMVLFVWASLAHRRTAGERSHPAIKLLWPLWLYDLLVIASCLNPGFREVITAGELSLVMGNPHSGWPSAAIPRLAAHELWQFNGLVLSSFNLLLVLQRRTQLRQVLFFLAGNAVVLAVFGTFQKLVGSPGLWFGAVKSPNTHFFSTFIYHNHWGAFILLNLGVCLALIFHHHRRGGHRDIWHSPVLLGAVVTLLLATSIPLSTSRSCTALAALLLTAALVHFLVRVVRQRHVRKEPAAGLVAAIILAAAVALGGVAYLGRDVIAQRSRLTSEQFTKLAADGALTARAVLYRDTWRMASAKPWFGWGLESYAHVFRIFNTQRAIELWVWIPFYAEAHNDWLQSLAEVGFVGTSLLVLLGVLPLASVRWRRVNSVIPRYLLGGCGLILLYAWLEFPFANPAVMLVFCSVFYCAIAYAGLDSKRENHA